MQLATCTSLKLYTYGNVDAYKYRGANDVRTDDRHVYIRRIFTVVRLMWGSLRLTPISTTIEMQSINGASLRVLDSSIERIALKTFES